MLSSALIESLPDLPASVLAIQKEFSQTLRERVP